ncbi:hypothetical protein BB560_005293, partial [Smittium megazygosporum]
IIKSNSTMNAAKIRNIYDYLEARNFARALSECNSLLLKEPESNILKAKLADEVLESESGNFDSEVINALSITFRNLGLKWFMSCVRELDLKNQNKAIVHLNKSHNKRHYLWWSIVTFYLTYKYSDSPQEKSISLSLAQRFCNKAIESKWANQRAEISLFILISLESGPIDHAVQYLESDKSLASLIEGNPDLRIQHLKLLSRYNDQKKNNWSEYVTVCSALYLFKNDNAVFKEKQSVIDSLLREYINDPSRKRNAMLCKLQLLVASKSKDTDLINKNLWDYFDVFCSKPHCFLDIAWYVQHFTSKGKIFNAWKKILSKRLEALSKSTPKSDHELLKLVNLEKFVLLTMDIANAYGHSCDLFSNEQKALDLLRLCKEIDTLKLSRDSKSDLAILAFYHMIKLYTTGPLSKEQDNILSFCFLLVSLIEQEIQKNESYYQFKLLAIRLHLKLGNYTRALELYKALSIKNIQNDSLAYWISNEGIILGSFKEELEVLYENVQLFDSNKADTPLMLSLTYENFSYDKSIEFYEFYNQLHYSIENKNNIISSLIVEMLINDQQDDIRAVISNSDIPYDVLADPTYILKISDNRDMTVLQCPSLSQVLELHSLNNPDSEKSPALVNNPKVMSFEQLTRNRPHSGPYHLLVKSYIPLALYYVSKKQISKLADTQNKFKKLLLKSFSTNIYEKPIDMDLLKSAPKGLVVPKSAYITGDKDVQQLVILKVMFDFANYALLVLMKSYPEYLKLDPVPDGVEIPDEHSAENVRTSFSAATKFLSGLKGPLEEADINKIPALLKLACIWVKCYASLWIGHQCLLSEDEVSPLTGQSPTTFKYDKRIIGDILSSSFEKGIKALNTLSSFIRNSSEKAIASYWINNNSETISRFTKVIKKQTLGPYSTKASSSVRESWLNSVSQLKYELERRR